MYYAIQGLLIALMICIRFFSLLILLPFMLKAIKGNYYPCFGEYNIIEKFTIYI